MKNSNLYSGEYVCLDKANVDTDQIIPVSYTHLRAHETP